MHLIFVLSAALVLQSVPTSHPADFTGSWKLVPARSESPQQSPPVTEMTFVIEQTANQVRLDVTSGTGRPISVIYPIIATPRQPLDPPTADERRAYWDGNRLVLERGGTISGQTVSSSNAVLVRVPGESKLGGRRHVAGQRRGRHHRGRGEIAFAADAHAVLPVAIE